MVQRSSSRNSKLDRSLQRGIGTLISRTKKVTGRRVSRTVSADLALNLNPNYRPSIKGTCRIFAREEHNGCRSWKKGIPPPRDDPEEGMSVRRLKLDEKFFAGSFATGD